MEEIVRRETSGVPLLWLPAEPPVDAALIFRAGYADETFARAGLCHLVEHLVMWKLGEPTYDCNAYVTGLITNFYAQGTVDEAKEFLERVAATFEDIPVERLETEKRVLRTEQASGTADYMLARRFGHQSFGLLHQPELSFLSVEASDVQTWARERYSTANAMVLWAGPEPPKMELRLPGPGAPTPLPSTEPLPGLKLPFADTGGDREILVGGVAPRSSALPVALLAAERYIHNSLRVKHGLVYMTDENREHLDRDSTHVTFRVDCLDDHAAEARQMLLDEMALLALEGIPQTDLDDARTIIERDLTARDGASSVLMRSASQLLCGGEMIQPSAMLAGYRAVTPRDAGDIIAAILDSAIVVSPEAIPPPGGRFSNREDIPTPPTVQGAEFRTKNLLRSRATRVVIGDRGLSIEHPTGSAMTMLWNDVVAVVRERSGNFYITARDGSWLYLEPETFNDPEGIRAAVESHVQETWVVPQARAEEAARVAELAEAQLPDRKTVARQLDRLPAELADGEAPIALAIATKALMRGLLAVTERQTLFLFHDEDGEPAVVSVLHHMVDRVTARTGMTGKQLRLVQRDGEEVVLRNVDPKGRAAELAALIDARRPARAS